jgi:hypothetical protein
VNHDQAFAHVFRPNIQSQLQIGPSTLRTVFRFAEKNLITLDGVEFGLLAEAITVSVWTGAWLADASANGAPAGTVVANLVGPTAVTTVFCSRLSDVASAVRACLRVGVKSGDGYEWFKLRNAILTQYSCAETEGVSVCNDFTLVSLRPRLCKYPASHKPAIRRRDRQ